MEVKVISVYGYDEALFGLGLSHGVTSNMTFEEYKTNHDLKERMKQVAERLAPKGLGHNKFLRAIGIVLDITAPFYWWKQFDTYKIGTVTQSESTMHTIMKTPIVSEMFEGGLDEETVNKLEAFRVAGDFNGLNRYLPQSFLQRRIIFTNYAVLLEISKQRKGHKLPEWKLFLEQKFFEEV